MAYLRRVLRGNRSLWFGIAISCTWLALVSPAEGARVVLIGIDGGTWNLIDPMRKRGELPHLQAIAERGAEARLSTVKPVTSPVVWTSVATGRSPEAHGVTDFFSTRLDIEVPTVFERLAADGARVGLYDYLLTWPPRTLPGGFVIPSWLRRDESVTPRDVWQRVPLSPYRNEYRSLRASEDYLARAREDVSLKAPRWKALAEAFDVEVGAVTFYAVDMTAHRFWHAGFPEEFEDPPPPGGPDEVEAVVGAMRGVDAAVGEIVASLAPEDTVLILSDHGFKADPEGGRNVWVSHSPELLEGSGLDAGEQPFSLVGTFGALTYRILPGDGSAEETRDRDALMERILTVLRSATDEAGNSLFGAIEFIDVAPRPAGFERGWWSDIRQWVVRKFLWLAFSTEVQDNSHAVIFGMPSNDALAAIWPDGTAQVGERRVPVRQLFSRQYFTGVHDPTAIFLAAGGPIADLDARGDLSVLDLAPLILQLAGRPIPDDLEGRLPTEILRPEYLAAHPMRKVPASELPGLASGDDEIAADDPELVEKLRRLGYIE